MSLPGGIASADEGAGEEFGGELGVAVHGWSSRGGFEELGRRRESGARLTGFEPGSGQGKQLLVGTGGREHEADPAGIAEDDGADLEQSEA